MRNLALMWVLAGVAVALLAAGVAAHEKSDVYSTEMLTELPFDYRELVEWQTAISLEEMENDGRYKELILFENQDLQQLIRPLDKHAHYFVLKSNKTIAQCYIIISSQEDKPGLFYEFVSILDNKKIASLSLGGYVDDNRDKTFTISKDLRITLFNEKSFYSEKEDKVIITEKKKIGTYQIQKDGRIVKQD